ncbi:ABC transporter ATP-binding protein [Paenibacillus sp. LHD-117]|uniref:ABC transporter ATP-binding protein n=1 Tax=Paenibacillus sp. LHD-117 TaxID=3071412 RepID=UPI0027DEB713|nr:ABC transporter ATP-binding protein [Paenibacillus sp. LHD-117]MDQ6422877.1 ABC transporter ATP-binding protein [Paenibacillus sp. LHD-117]
MPYARYIRKYWKSFSIAVLFVAIESGADLMMPTLLAHIIDEGIANNDLDYVLRMGAFMLLITAMGAVAASIRNVVASHVSQKFGTELRSDLFAKIQSLSFDNMNKFDRGSLITRLTGDVTLVQNFLNGMMRIFVKAPILGIGALIMAFRLNWNLSMILLVVVPIVIVLVTLNIRVGFSRFMKVQQSLDKVNSTVREYLSGVRVVKAFNRFDYEVDRFERSNEDQRARSTNAMRAMSVFNPAIMLTVNFGIVAVLWLGGRWLDASLLPVGHLVAFVNYMTQILFALMMLTMVFTMFIRAKASAQRIGEVFKQENAMTWREDGQWASDARGAIEFDRVTFSYDGTAGSAGSAAVDGVSFRCLPGETIGIVGSTGAGKSSLVELIPRFYDADSGTIRVNGTYIRELDPAMLRERIAIVPQKTMLFSGTIMENIRWGREDATEAEVIAAAKLSEAHEFIAKLPEGYASVLGQRGVNLSGGQKQRVSIARALIRKPDILILDDCTSAVDMTTEARIKESLKAYAKNMTCILIAQRITSVMDADNIIVMDHGKIVDIGTHSKLLDRCRVYQEIYESQVGKELKPDVC